MQDSTGFALEAWDYLAFVGFLLGTCMVGYWAGRKERAGVTEYFLAGKRLPWYVVGGSFIASNISSEHFIGMVGAACVYGVCVAMSEWMNILSFSLLIWIFIPFLLASQVFTTPEFLERRFSPLLRQLFAVVTITSNVVAFLAAVLYGGGLAVQSLFHEHLAWLAGWIPGWMVPSAIRPDVELWLAIIILGVLAGVWAIYGGLSSVAWSDLFMLVVMVGGGISVTFLGLHALADGGSLVDGFTTMLHRNEAREFLWKPAVTSNLANLTGQASYNRLSVFQPASHPTHPWPSLIFGVFTVSIWYNVLNQFMIQRVLGAKNSYHARMGIVMAGFLKVLMPAIVVVPGLILFALHPEILLQPWQSVRPEADQGYVRLLETLVPAGLRGLFLAALFGAIQSTINAVLNSTATVFTLDVYKRMLVPRASDRHLVWTGIVSSTAFLVISIVLAGFIGRLGGSLFVYIQTLYFFFGPPFAAVFLLGILWKRINAAGALTAVVLGFLLGIGLKLYVQHDPNHPLWLSPYANQGIVNWAFCTVICTVVSLVTAPPPPEQVDDHVTINWSKLNIFGQLGGHWYTSVVTWWLVFVACIVGLFIFFSGFVFPGNGNQSPQPVEAAITPRKGEVAAHARCLLGEAPLWHPHEKCLYWADIDRGRLYRLDPATGEHRVVLEGRPIAGLCCQVDGSLLLFRDRGTVDVYRDGKIVRTGLVEIPDEAQTRFNDVIADPWGRVFCGMLPNGNRPGRLYRLDPDGSCRVVLEGVGCSNGMGFSSDLKRFYHTDSTARTIWVFDYDLKTGDLSNRSVFARTDEGVLPDGLTVDADDNIWSAQWQGGSVVCYAPDGSVRQEIELPARRITSVTFGGAEYSDLYITSAAKEETGPERRYAGDLFRLQPGVRGRAQFFSRLGMGKTW